jgi:hypothetical protein
MQPEEPPPDCFWQTVGRPITQEQLERVRSQGREALCEFFMASRLNEQSRYKLLRAFFPISFREFRALEERVARSVGEACTIYVPLVEEGTEVWRPANAVRVSPGVFRLGGPVPEGESWAFAPGESVRCAVRVFSGGAQALAAFERAEAQQGAAPARGGM